MILLYYKIRNILTNYKESLDRQVMVADLSFNLDTV
jgi:hypothetical protein